MSEDAQEYHLTMGMEEAAAVKQWLPIVTAAMELPATELFLKLRRGQIEATGKLLPDGVEIIDFVEDQNSYSRGDFDDLSDTIIPHEFWTMPGIDWLSNAVTANGKRYCDVSMSVEAVMSYFPGERRQVNGAEFVGDFLLVKEPSADNVPQFPRRTPGHQIGVAHLNAALSVWSYCEASAGYIFGGVVAGKTEMADNGSVTE